MHLEHQRIIDCSAMLASECSDKCLVALEHCSDFALRADVPTDTVHGSVTIVHNAPPIPHEFIVEVYEADEAPTSRQSTLKRPTVMPTEETLRTRLDTLA
jgi:hypothetical protein